MDQLQEAPGMGGVCIAPPVGTRVCFKNYTGAPVSVVTFGYPFSATFGGRWLLFLNGVGLTPVVDFTYQEEGIALKSSMQPLDKVEGVFLGLEAPTLGVPLSGSRIRALGQFSPETGVVYFDRNIPPDLLSFDLYIGGAYVPPDRIRAVYESRVHVIGSDPKWNTRAWANFIQVN